MKKFFIAIIAICLTFAANARPYMHGGPRHFHGHHGHGYGAAIAGEIIGGILLGAIIANALDDQPRNTTVVYSPLTNIPGHYEIRIINGIETPVWVPDYWR